MKKCGYYNHDIELVKDDVTLFSGMGNPFHHVKIEEGQPVLDIGCGVGVDTLIAKYYAKTGYVCGIDADENSVLLAKEIAKEKDLDVRFRNLHLDEGLSGMNMNCYKYIISNGSYQDFEDKVKMFTMLHKVLRPDGKMVICTAVARDNDLVRAGKRVIHKNGVYDSF
jgi:cyclopropane fatty-acyl-phospholipid synthase-like methyltransferase